LQRVENGKDDLSWQSDGLHGDSKSSKEPRDAEEEHDSHNADQQADNGLGLDGLVLASETSLGVFDQDYYHRNEDNTVAQDHQ